MGFLCSPAAAAAAGHAASVLLSHTGVKSLACWGVSESGGRFLADVWAAVGGARAKLEAPQAQRMWLSASAHSDSKLSVFVFPPQFDAAQHEE
jgi:hypothetical protein